LVDLVSVSWWSINVVESYFGSFQMQCKENNFIYLNLYIFPILVMIFCTVCTICIHLTNLHPFTFHNLIFLKKGEVCED
jgi:hypothetical protein